MLMDLLGGGPAPAPAPPPAAPAGMDAMAAMMGGPAMSLGGAAAGGFAPFAAFNKHGLLVTFACSKEAANPSVTAIEASFTNSTPAPIGALNFQASSLRAIRVVAIRTQRFIRAHQLLASLYRQWSWEHRLGRDDHKSRDE